MISFFFLDLSSSGKLLSKEKVSGKQLECPHCGDTFKFPFSLLRHISCFHSNERHHPCGGCRKHFVTLSDLKEHSNRCPEFHRQRKPFQCKKCHWTFGTQDSCRRHGKYSCQFRKHSGMSTATVKVSSKNIAERTLSPNLSKTSKTKNIVETYFPNSSKTKIQKKKQCRYCGKLMCHLARHVKWYCPKALFENRKAFICKQCGVKCKSPDAFRNHSNWCKPAIERTIQPHKNGNSRTPVVTTAIPNLLSTTFFPVVRLELVESKKDDLKNYGKAAS